MKGLSPTEYKLLSFMRAMGVGVEVSIDAMFADIVGPAPDPNQFDIRSKQQYVGAFASRINRKQDNYKIVPGKKLKHTYCVEHKKKRVG